MNIQFSVNDESVTVDAAEDCPLLYVLRNDLGLTGPRFGCGAEQCGACRVLVDGLPAYSCTVTAAACDGKSVTTAEGMDHPVQQALLDLNAGQCGYCLTGIVTSAIHLLNNTPRPTRAEIQQALDDHLCRCGSHNRIIRAIQLAAERMDA